MFLKKSRIFIIEIRYTNVEVSSENIKLRILLIRMLTLSSFTLMFIHTYDLLTSVSPSFLLVIL